MNLLFLTIIILFAIIIYITNYIISPEGYYKYYRDNTFLILILIMVIIICYIFIISLAVPLLYTR
jgi:hypothetical protein